MRHGLEGGVTCPVCEDTGRVVHPETLTVEACPNCERDLRPGERDGRQVALTIAEALLLLMLVIAFVVVWRMTG